MCTFSCKYMPIREYKSCVVCTQSCLCVQDQIDFTGSHATLVMFFRNSRELVPPNEVNMLYKE